MSAPVDIYTKIPAEWSDLVPVTRESFHATAGQLNVHPCPQGKHDSVLGYRCDWKFDGGAGKRIASSIGGTFYTDTAYLVTPEFYEANRDALIRIGESA